MFGNVKRAFAKSFSLDRPSILRFYMRRSRFAEARAECTAVLELRPGHEKARSRSGERCRDAELSGCLKTLAKILVIETQSQVI